MSYSYQHTSQEKLLGQKVKTKNKFRSTMFLTNKQINQQKQKQTKTKQHKIKRNEKQKETNSKKLAQ